MKGVAFSEGLSTDSLYSIAVTAKSVKIDRSTITAVTGEVTDSFEIFKDREIVNKGKAPFNYQFGSTGGLLARDTTKYDQIDSVSYYRIDFQKRINALREDLGRDSQATVAGYMRRLSKGQEFMDLLNKHSINTALSTFAKEKDIGKLFSNALFNPADLSEEQRVIVTAFLNLLLYIDSSFIYCPACGNLVSLSWGWCPYHATREYFNEKGVMDQNGDGKLKTEFVNYLLDKLQDPSLANLIQNEPKKGRILVHWTEFIVS